MKLFLIGVAPRVKRRAILAVGVDRPGVKAVSYAVREQRLGELEVRARERASEDRGARVGRLRRRVDRPEDRRVLGHLGSTLEEVGVVGLVPDLNPAA